MAKMISVTAGALVLGHPLFSAGTGAAPESCNERVRFAKGATSAVIKGQLRGDSDVNYLVNAGAGQTITVSLKSSKPRYYFNVLPSGSKNVAMYAEQTGEDFKGVLPTDGHYTMRGYLVRAAARRDESSNYTLSIGEALAPIPMLQDAVIPGTPFHAKAKMTCVPFLETKAQGCETFAIRRGSDRMATIEVHGGRYFKRRIPFVKRKPVGLASSDALSFSRKADLNFVSLGAEERYEIPDALIRGG